MTQLHELTALEQWTALRRGETSPAELTDHYLARIERLNPQLGAFTTVTAEAARARALDLRERVPTSAPLWGLPIGDKDLWQRAGVPTGYGSRLADPAPATRSDDIVRVLDAAGVVSLGKTSTPEFGLPSYTEPVAGPIARNPWDTSRGAGGSSGGAAVAVAAGLLPVAPGSDGGGSIRIPAAACGLVGLKPSRGLVPAGSGVDSLAGLAVAGPLARTVADAALLLDALTPRVHGRIDYPHTLRSPDSGPFLGPAVRGEGRFQVGVMTSSAWDGAYDITLDPAAITALEIAVAACDRLGHGLEHTSLRPDDSYADAFRTIWQASAATIPVDAAHAQLLEPLTRWLMERGRALTAGALWEAVTSLTRYERSLIEQLSGFDAVLTPALALAPRPLGWFDAEDGDRNFAQQVQYTPFTSMVNVAGLPAITLPVHVTEDGLPMGVQLIGRPGGEATLLSLGAQLERAINWQIRHPPGW